VPLSKCPAHLQQRQRRTQAHTHPPGNVYDDTVRETRRTGVRDARL
jgi:hypothetical protein